MAAMGLCRPPPAPQMTDHTHTHRFPQAFSAWRGKHCIPSATKTWNLEVNRGVLPQQELGKIASLLAAAFSGSGGDDGEEPPSPTQVAAYQFKLMAALQFRCFTEGRQFVTLLAYGTAPEKELAGVVTIGPGWSSTGADGHSLDLPDGHVVASISNMAVAKKFRRQGLGKYLLGAVEEATSVWPVAPSVFALSVYRTNEAARKLYETSGYVVDDTWTDPVWLVAAEKGHVSGERRYLMLKKVMGWEEEEEEEDWQD